MRKWLSAFTLIELLVVIAIIAILAGLLLPALARAREESRRKACNSNIGQIVKACATYQEPNGDFFPAHWDGFNSVGANNPGSSSSDDIEGLANPMQSIALLYPAYIDNPKVYRCPSTNDTPHITVWYVNAARQNVFAENFDYSVDDGATKLDGTAYAISLSGSANGQYNSNFVATNVKSSYMYDSLTHFRDIGPSQAMLADADGMTWIEADGGKPEYAAAPSSQSGLEVTYARLPRKPNHENGQNVMYFDGHVTWKETNYASDDPKDNIYCRNGSPDANSWRHTFGGDTWGLDTDAWVWDEHFARNVQSSD